MTAPIPVPLSADEYIEQAYLFSAMKTRLSPAEPVQMLLAAVRQEVLATVRLPMAIDYMLAELNHSGSMATAMQGMPHYFAPFQAWLMKMAEEGTGKLDMVTATAILEHEASYRATGATPVALFLYQFEVLCRHRLSYDAGLTAMSGDPFFNQEWKKWLLESRKKLGFVDIADLIYVHSDYYLKVCGEDAERPDAVLFGEKEGRIALANRRRDPLYLFAAFQRQLKYPRVPDRPKADPQVDLVPRLAKRIDQLEMRLKLLEDEQKDTGIDLSKFYKKENFPPAGFEDDQ